MSIRPSLRRFDWVTLAVLMLALPLIIPFFAPGMPMTADGEIHLHRIVSAAVDINAGYWWPRWTPYLHAGYGYPIHNFYAPGLHILGALIYLSTRLDPLIILKLLQIAATLLYPLGAYRFARTFTGKPGALVAAAAYTYAPFRFTELWMQGNLSQFWAMALLPWLFWALARGAQTRRRHWIAIVGLLFGAIILLHHPTGFLIAPFAGGYALCLMLGQTQRQRVRAALMLIAGLALGLLLSAIFWLPALVELQYTQINRVEQGIFSVTANFISLAQLIRPVAPVDRALLDPSAFYSLGLPQIIAVLLGLAVIVKGRRRLKLNVICGALATALCLWLITPSSVWVWLNLPIAKLVIYPWRLLGEAALAVIPGAAALPSLFPVRWRGAAAGAAVGLFFAAALPMLYAPLTFYAVPPATPETELAYERTTGNLGLTSADEYLPLWAQQRPLGLQGETFGALEWSVGLDPASLPANASVASAACPSGSSCYTIDAPQTFTLLFHQLYFPGWTVTLDGQPTDPAPSGVNGLLSIPFPSGRHEVSVRYGGTTIQAVGAALSALGLVLLLALIVTARLKFRLPARLPDAETRRLALRVVAVIGGFVLINQVYLLPQTSVFRYASDPAAPPAEVLVQHQFGGLLELVGYDVSPQPARAGDTLTVRLYWRALQPLDQSLRASVHLTALDGQQDWGGAESLSIGGLSPQRWTTDGYATDDYQFQVHADASPFVGELRVSAFTSPTDYLTAENNSTVVVIGTLRLAGDRRLFADSSLTAANADFGGQITLAGVGLSQSDSGATCLDLRWQAERDHLPDETVMLHLLDAAGTTVAIDDAPPLDGLYPTSQWQGGQTLDDPHCFALPAAASQVQVALYAADGTRLPLVTASAYPVADNALQIPLR